MAKCKFCGKEIAHGTGKMLIKNDGKILHFCSNKCEKNFSKLKRKPRETKWTEDYRAEKATTKSN